MVQLLAAIDQAKLRPAPSVMYEVYKNLDDPPHSRLIFHQFGVALGPNTRFMATGRYGPRSETRQTTRESSLFAPNRVHLVENVGVNASYASSVVDGHFSVIPPGTYRVRAPSGDSMV